MAFKRRRIFKTVSRPNSPRRMVAASVALTDKISALLISELLAAFACTTKEGANKRGNSSRLTQSFHFFMFEPIFSPVNALNQPI
ncbi:hypothetical protein L8R07_22860, partial [Enterobacter roggenkampii]